MTKNKKSKHISPNKKREGVINENIDLKQNATNSYDDNHGKDIDDLPPNWWGTGGTGPGEVRMGAGVTGMGMYSSPTHGDSDNDDKNDNIYSHDQVDVSHRNDTSKDRVTIKLTDLQEEYLRNPSKHHHNGSSDNAEELSHDKNDINDTEWNDNGDDNHDSDDLDTYINEKIKENSNKNISNLDSYINEKMKESSNKNMNNENENIFIGNLQNDDDDDDEVYSDTESDTSNGSIEDKNTQLNKNKKTVYDLSHDVDDDTLNENENGNENIDQNLYGDLYSNFLFGKTIEATDKVLQKDYDSDLDDLDDEHIVFNKRVYDSTTRKYDIKSATQKYQYDPKTVFSSSIPSESGPLPFIPPKSNARNISNPNKDPVNNNETEHNPKYWSEDPNPFESQPQVPVSEPIGTGPIGVSSIPQPHMTGTEPEVFENPLHPNPSFSFGSHPATRRQSGKPSSAHSAYQAYNAKKQIKNNQNNTNIFQSTPEVVDLTEEDEDLEAETHDGMDIDDDGGRQNHIERNQDRSRSTTGKHEETAEALSGLAESYRKEVCTYSFE
jgi:hypothetical protein